MITESLINRAIDGLLSNGTLCRQPVAAGWSLAYEWQANVIEFGPMTGDGRPTCRASPNRVLIGAGYVLTTVGWYELSTGRPANGPITAHWRSVRHRETTDR